MGVGLVLTQPPTFLLIVHHFKERRRMMSVTTVSKERVRALQGDVLLTQMDRLVRMGDPNRYLIDLRAAKILDRDDCERIRAKVTTKDRVELLVDFLREEGRGTAERTPFEVLVEVVMKEGVHSGVVDKLMAALEKAIKEEERVQGTQLPCCLSLAL